MLSNNSNMVVMQILHSISFCFFPQGKKENRFCCSVQPSFYWARTMKLSLCNYQILWHVYKRQNHIKSKITWNKTKTSHRLSRKVMFYPVTLFWKVFIKFKKFSIFQAHGICGLKAFVIYLKQKGCIFQQWLSFGLVFQP